jgi:putative transposase
LENPRPLERSLD